jgi:hypothetical protein
MIRIDIPRIRCKVDLGKKTGTLTDVISGEPFYFPRGSDLRLEFGLFFGDEIADISQITTARLRIRRNQSPDSETSLIAVDKTIGLTSMNTGLTAAAWDEGDQNAAHFIFEFEAAELAESVFGDDPDPEASGSDSGLADEQQGHWLMLTNGATDRHLWAGVVRSFDAGYGTTGNAPPADPANISKAEVDALLSAFAQQFVKYVGNPRGSTVELTSPSGAYKFKVGCDDEGNPSLPSNI